MTLGFTGTQRGMRHRQLKAVRQLLWNVEHLHLGDCIGADAEAHEECQRLGVLTSGHPPSDGDRRANLSYDHLHAPKSYLVRNMDIVDEGVDGLIAAPHSFVEMRRSGTWATVRYARKVKRHIWLVMPDGTVKEENA